MKSEKKMSLMIAVLTLCLAGCASMQPLSNYARSGDTVAISLGGTESNALIPVLKKQNIAITITDAAGAVHPVKLRSIFRVYSDPTSAYQGRSPYSSTQWTENWVQPNEGIWMAIIDLVDPNTGQAPVLAVGAAKLGVSSPDIQNWVDYSGHNWSWTNGNLSNIPIEILAGTGSANPMNYQSQTSYAPLTALEPDPQVEVRPSGTPNTTIGGAFFVFKYVESDFAYARNIRAVTTVPDSNVQVASSRISQGDGTALLKVMITNPLGFGTTNDKSNLTTGQSLLRNLRVTVAWDRSLTNITDSNWQNSLQLQSARFVDIYGDPMPELTAAVTKVQ